MSSLLQMFQALDEEALAKSGNAEHYGRLLYWYLRWNKERGEPVPSVVDILRDTGMNEVEHKIALDWCLGPGKDMLEWL